MKSLRHRLPALHSLLVFEAAARHLNFTQAAAELHVSQAAISKQIKYLEEYFGFTLFQREGRKVMLTGAGSQLYSQASAALNYLADGVTSLQEQQQGDSISVAANTAVSQFWLNNAVSEFYRQYPRSDLNIRLVSSDQTSDLFADDIDLNIAYEPGLRGGWALKVLLAEILYPVASPEYLRLNDCRADYPQDLLNYCLLDFDRVEPNWINWKVWFESLGISRAYSSPRRFSNYMVLMDAARRGQGVALGTAGLVDQQLTEGSLQRLGNLQVVSGRSYWLGVNENRAGRPGVQIFFRWLQERSQ